jgi:hypothetical protein
MKTIIMAQTIPLLCKTQEEVDKLLEESYVLKEVKEIKYLVKNEIL